MAKGYYRSLWNGIPVFQCLRCGFDNMKESVVVSHVESRHNIGIPLASCIMPTYNRRQFATRAIEAFLQQTYPNKELIVVDDGIDRIDDLVIQHIKVTYVRPARKMTVGMKRNIAVASSSGDFIIHWDDDDCHHRTRIEEHVKGLKTHLVTGLRRIWFGAPGDPSVRELVGWDGWLSGASLGYRREAWERHQFPDVNVGEDAAFISQFDREKLDLNKPWIVLITNHPGNTSNRTNLKYTQVPYREE